MKECKCRSITAYRIAAAEKRKWEQEREKACREYWQKLSKPHAGAKDWM